MLACAYAALPDLPTDRAGVIRVGLARCIAMVMIWNQLAEGDINLCAIIVIINSLLQIALYSPFTIFFTRIFWDSGGIEDPFDLQYGPVAIAVLVVSVFATDYLSDTRANSTSRFHGLLVVTVPVCCGELTLKTSPSSPYGLR
jgi:ACR3 family arsenite efflux pump ArsB